MAIARKENAALWLNRAVFTAGGFSFLLGLIVIAGWYAGNLTLLKVFPTFEAMRFNTALGFFLSGIGLLAPYLHRPNVSRACGWAVGSLGLLALFQYLTGVNLGIDHLFIKDTISSSYPGRMAPPTALSFMIIGAALLLMDRPVFLRSAALTVGLLGSITVSLGVTALSGYLTGVMALSVWGDLISMALHTAVGFIMLGTGVIAFAWQRGMAEEKGAFKWLPVIIGVGLLTGTLILWRLIAAQEASNIERTVKFKTTQVSYDIQDQMEYRVKALVRMARRWEIQGRPLREEWESDAGLYLNHYVGLQAIGWVGPALRERWIVSVKRNEPGLERYLGLEERTSGAMKAAADRHEPAISPCVQLAGGGRAFMSYVPIFHEGNFDGFIVGVFGVKELLDSILLHEAGAEYSIAISNGGTEIYDYDTEAGETGKWAQEAKISLYGSDWHVRVWPKEEFLASLKSILPGMILVMGVFMSLLLSLVLHLSQTAHHRAKTAEAAKHELENEVCERKMAEERAERHSMELALSNIEMEREVAERKRAEEIAHRQAQELARSNAELEQFAYVASHDLQEPLRMVASYVQLLERRYKGKLDAKADNFISYAVDGATRMQRLINDLLAYSRVGSRSKEFAPVDCAQVLNRTLANLKAAIDESAATVTFDSMPTFEADATQLEHLFMNLIGNAIKYRREHAPSIHVSAAQRPGEWLISVRDNGIGIDPKYHERIFVIFQRLHGKNEYSGTGIGLAICKKVVENHGGLIWVDSEPGAGSTFHFTIPNRGA